MNKIKAILLIDDDPIANWLNKTILEDLQLIEHIACYTDSGNALEYLIGAHTDAAIDCPDIIFLDLNMPVINGFEFLDELMQLENCGQLCKQVVMLSSSMHQEDMSRALGYGVHAYLVKPLTTAQAQKIVNNFSQIS